jgi:hypothetical protein
VTVMAGDVLAKLCGKGPRPNSSRISSSSGGGGGSSGGSGLPPQPCAIAAPMHRVVARSPDEVKVNLLYFTLRIVCMALI